MSKPSSGNNVWMGSDINLVVERRELAGAWGPIESRSGSVKDWYEERAYECFSLLTGLDFSGRVIRPATPVAPLRGWPSDAARETLELLESWGDDTTYGKSWLSSRDFSNYDWNMRLDWSYMTSPPNGQGLSAHDRESIKAYVRENGRLPEGWKVLGWSRDGFPVVGSIRRSELAMGFIEKVVNPMRSMAGRDPDSVRCVFSFVR